MTAADRKNGANIRGRSIPPGRPRRLALWRRLGYGKLRRFFLVHFREGYVQSRLRLRKGDCNQCGCCCKLVVPCVLLTGRGLCRIYGGRRWLVCKVFPIDDRDLEDIELTGGRCGYYWR